MRQSAEKAHVLMICAHEPSADPRIRWEAELASSEFAVTVLGFRAAESVTPEIDRTGSYTVVSLQRLDSPPAYYFWRLKEVIPRSMLLLLAVISTLTYPILVLSEVLYRLAKSGSALVTIALPLVMLKRLLEGTELGAAFYQFYRLVLLRKERFYYILGVLRMQFAPATAIFWKYIADSAVKPQVIHCNDLDTLLVGVLAKTKFGCRLVYDAHEFFPVSDSHCRWLDTTFFLLIERLLIRKADVVVTVNPLLAEAMRDAYSLSRVYSVPNAEMWMKNRFVAPRSCMAKLAGNRVKFLFQGRFTSARGIEQIITAWSKVDGSRAALFLRGPDNAWQKAAIELAEGLGLLNRSVYFLDAVKEEMLVSAAAEADVGIIPYLPIAINERLSCPNKLSQYLHAGLMIISNDLPYVKSIIAEASAGLSYTSDNLSTLVAVVGQVASDPELLRRCRENALRFARESFNWQVHGKALLRLYSGNLAEEPEHLNEETHGQTDDLICVLDGVQSIVPAVAQGPVQTAVVEYLGDDARRAA